MQANGSRKLNGLDHLRALAIILVFFYHYRLPFFGHPAWLNDVGQFGWTGVDLFFVLSGYLISSQLFSQIRNDQIISFKEFFIKRAFRIIPAFLVVVCVYFLFPAFQERGNLLPLWRYLTFTQNFGLDIAHYGTFSHAWSLCVEEHFYLLLPLVLLLLQFTNLLKHSYWILIVLFILGLVLRDYSWTHYYLPSIAQEGAGILWYKFVYYPTFNRLDGLLIGVSISAISHFLPNVWRQLSRFGNFLILTGLLLLTITFWVCTEEMSYRASVFGFPLIAIGYGFMVSGAVSPSSVLFKWNSKVTTLIATLSYGIYLSHKGIIHVTQGTLGNFIDQNSGLMLVICLGSSLGTAFVLNLLIEKPFLRMRQWLLYRRNQTEDTLFIEAIASGK